MKTGDYATIRSRIERLEALFEIRGREFARYCGVGEATINAIKERNVGITANICEKISKATGCSFMWLMTGAGDWGLVVARSGEPPSTIPPRTAPTIPKAGSAHSRRRVKRAKISDG